MRESLSEITDKQVINLCDGRFLGYVSDVKIDVCQGRITDIIIPSECGFFGSKKGSETVIPWEKICKIGTDVIIVDTNSTKIDDCTCANEGKKHIFKS